MKKICFHLKKKTFSNIDNIYWHGILQCTGTKNTKYLLKVIIIIMYTLKQYITYNKYNINIIYLNVKAFCIRVWFCWWAGCKWEIPNFKVGNSFCCFFFIIIIISDYSKYYHESKIYNLLSRLLRSCFEVLNRYNNTSRLRSKPPVFLIVFDYADYVLTEVASGIMEY